MPSEYTTALVFKKELLELVLNGEKDITRRTAKKGRAPWRQGALCKIYGQRPEFGGKLRAIARIVSARLERLDAVTKGDVIREGFPSLSPKQFVQLFADLYDLENAGELEVWRVEFELVRVF